MSITRRPRAELLVCAPLRIEANALAAGIDPQSVRRTGAGQAKAAATAAGMREETFDALAVAGFCGALHADAEPGDVVVASEVRGATGTIGCPSAELLAGELRRAGHRVHIGPVVTTDHVVHGAERAELAARGAIACDMESAPLLAAAGDRPVACVRVVVDTPDRPLLDVRTVPGGMAARRVLRGVGPALRTWADAAGERRVLLAEPRSFCAGVERAIEIVERALELHGAPVYVRKQIVHNVHVVGDLERRGAIFVDELDEVPAGATVVFSAHGVSPAVRTEAEQRELSIIDATCPLVTKVHAEARRYAGRGAGIVFIGHAGHEETEGTLGEAPGSTVLVEHPEDVADLEMPDPTNVAYLMQTTLAADEADDIATAIRERYPAAVGPSSEDICYATTNRQQAVREVAGDADVVLVVGSPNSSNSKRLVEVAERAGARAYLVDDPSGIDPSWLVGARTVGLSAGASAPPGLVNAVVEALRGLGPVDVVARSVVSESVHFTLPKEVRS